MDEKTCISISINISAIELAQGALNWGSYWWTSQSWILSLKAKFPLLWSTSDILYLCIVLDEVLLLEMMLFQVWSWEDGIVQLSCLLWSHFGLTKFIDYLISGFVPLTPFIVALMTTVSALVPCVFVSTLLMVSLWKSQKDPNHGTRTYDDINVLLIEYSDTLSCSAGWWDILDVWTHRGWLWSYFLFTKLLPAVGCCP